jgi:hypothetical protein|tara:strand:+ start:314 stop:658 length:345 start_codon:yes stop_codon:yes gene_type:complete
MALALNNYETITAVVGVNTVGIYTAPTGYDSIVLLAQCTNIGTDTQTITFAHERTVSGIAVTTEILKDFPLPANDSANLVSGKLVLETGDSLVISSSSNTDVKFISSVLETLNQ